MKAKKRIIIVQNDQYLIVSRKAMLEQRGYQVDSVHTMQEARTACREFSCDLVVVDSEEDYRAALELCEEIKAENPSVNVAVIAWHGTEIESDCPDEVIRRERGPEEFIAKVRLALA